MTETAPVKRDILVTRFAVISGVGWLLDFTLFNLMVLAGIMPGRANLISAGLAVLFVFITSRRHLFAGAQRPLGQAMALYAAYNVLAVALASLAVGALSGLVGALLGHGCNALYLALCGQVGKLGPAAAKIVVTPATMYANFVASAFINTKRFRFT